MRIDVDDARPLSLGEIQERADRCCVRVILMQQKRSPSGKGWHLRIWIDPAPRTACETVALQLLLGSDPYREAYNLNRARCVDAGLVSDYWRERWNVLYGRVEPAVAASK